MHQKKRGNLNTRLTKLDSPDSPYDAIVLAHAGLERLGFSHRISQPLDALYHAVGQAAIAVQCRSGVYSPGDEWMRTLLAQLQHQESFIVCTAERAFMVCARPLLVAFYAL